MAFSSDNLSHYRRRARSRSAQLFFFLLLLTMLGAGASAQPKPEEVTFPSGKLQLHGFLWKPEGKGPFPAVLWNHGSEKLPGWRPELGRFYVEHNYVLFIPHRRGQGRSPGDYIQDLVAQAPAQDRARRMVQLQEAEVDDVVAALNYLKSQTFVDPGRIAISGCSFGGIQTLLTGERDLGVRALVPFAPGAMSWERSPPLQERLKESVDRAKAPIFMLQAENDFSIAPSHELSKQAKKKNADFQSKIYPAFGNGPEDGHGKFCATATDVWGKDVLAFLEAHMKAAK
jgi:dienelactone hydrolase